MDWFQYKWLWSPFKWIGNRFSFLTGKLALVVFGIFIIAGIYLDLTPEKIPEGSQIYFASFFALAGLMLILRAFVERGDARQAWVEIFIAQLFLTLAIGIYHEEFGQDYMLIYLSGSLLSSAVGLVCLTRLRRSEPDMQLNRFHGHSYEYPGLGLVFLICCLGLIGFPFTPTFVGIDLLFSHIQKGEIVLIVLVALSFLFMEMAILRIYSRIFMGQHIKPYHPIAYRSS